MAHRFSFVSSRSLATLVAGCLASVFVTGCNDPELEKQAAYERQFNEVAAEYAKTLGGRPDLLSTNPSDESITALRAVADKAKGLSGGSAGQQTAARSLAASVYRTSASIELARGASTQLDARFVVFDGAADAARLAGMLDTDG
jgi:phosphopantothenoylcysteine synthetase/decarboxylase